MPFSPRTLTVTDAGEGAQSPLLKGDQEADETSSGSVQFTSAIFYADMTEDEAHLDIMRIGDSQTSCAVKYATEDVSAKAGATYTAVSGEVEFEAGDCMKEIVVPLLRTGIFNSTVEFQIHLSTASGCKLGRLRSSRVKVIDDNIFPSNRYRAEQEKHGAKAVGSWPLYWEYCKWNLRSTGMLPWVVLILIFDQLKNIHMLVMIWCDMYFVNVICSREANEEEFLFATRQDCIYFVAALHALPPIIFYIWQFLRAKMDVEGRSALQLQKQAFRKSLNYSAEVHETIGSEALIFNLLTEIPKVAGGFDAGLDLVKVLVREGLLVFFVALKNPLALWYIMAVPPIIIAWAVFRSRCFTTPGVKSETTCVSGFVEEASRKHDLTRAFYIRPQMNSDFGLAVTALREKVVKAKVHKLNTDAVLHWIVPVCISLYIVTRTHRVIDQEIKIGTLLAMIAVIRDVAQSTLEAYFTTMAIVSSFNSLRGTADILNKETEVRKLKDMNRMRRSRSSTSIAANHGVDAIPVVVKNVSYSTGSTELLEDITVEVEQGKLVAIRGPHKSAKNVFIDILGGLVFPTTGQVFMPSHLRTLFVAREAVFLDRSLVNNLSIGCPLFGDTEFARLKAILNALRFDRAISIIEEEMADEAKRSGPDNWSRSMSYTDKQMLGIARAFLMDPEVLIFEKPFSPFSRDIVGHLTGLFVEHTRNRGLCMPKETYSSRRPRTLFFSAEEPEDTGCADVEWIMETTGRKNAAGLFVWTIAQ